MQFPKTVQPRDGLRSAQSHRKLGESQTCTNFGLTVSRRSCHAPWCFGKDCKVEKVWVCNSEKRCCSTLLDGNNGALAQLGFRQDQFKS